MSQVAGQSAISPLSTGGSGVYFEQHVGAAFLSLLLVRGIPPCLPLCQLGEVHFQTGHEGWHTDDLLLMGTKSNGQKVRLAAQVKRSIRVSRRDDDFHQTIADAWRDYAAKAPFNPESDALAIITLRGSESLLNDFTTLLDLARFSSNAGDFAHRLEVPGFANNKVRHYRDEVVAIVEEAAGHPVDGADYLEFLKRLHLLSFDLNTPTHQTEAWIKTLLAHTAIGPDKLAASEATWNELLQEVGAGAPHAAGFTFETLPKSARGRHSLVPDADHHWLAVLIDHSKPVQRGVKDSVAGTTHVQRTALLGEIVTALEEHRAVIVTGPPGAGKSALAKEAFETLARELPAFAFRSEEFARPHVDEVFHAAQVQLTAGQLSALLALQPRKLIWIESLERLLERSEREALSDLLRLVKEDDSCRLVLTCRDYSLEQVRSSFLGYVGLAHHVLQVGPFSDAELDQVLKACPVLKELTGSPPLRELLRNPYILDKASQMDWRKGASLPENERSFRHKVWQDIVRDDSNIADSMPHRRGNAFIEVALRRARALSPYADCSGLDRQALERLKQNGLLQFGEGSDSMAALAHDILEDWALLKWLDELHARKMQDPPGFVADVGTHPALRRSYRRWLEELLECVPTAADQLVSDTVTSKQLPQQARDDTLTAVLLSKNAPDFLQRNEALLLAQNADLLQRAVHLLRVGCRTGPIAPLENKALAGLVEAIMPIVRSLPKYPAWAAVLRILRKHLAALGREQMGLVLGLLEDWGQGVSWYFPCPPGAEDAAQLAFALLPQSDDWRFSERQAENRLLKIVTKIPRGAPTRFQQLVERAIADPEDHVPSEFAELILEHLDGWPACRDFPDLVIRLAEAKWGISVCRSKPRQSGFVDNFEVEMAFGLDPISPLAFYPPSALHGPFWALLSHRPQLGLEFIVRLLNHCSDCYGNPEVLGLS
jgi:hypothetical protein